MFRLSMFLGRANSGSFPKRVELLPPCRGTHRGCLDQEETNCSIVAWNGCENDLEKKENCRSDDI